jgi:hypothetical protein
MSVFGKKGVLEDWKDLRPNFEKVMKIKTNGPL